MPAMEIKANDVQKLRQMTGAGLMDCKKALSDAGGDFDKAIQILREQGITKSSKRSDRVAAEGLVEAWVSDDHKQAIVLELNCETDFVARNNEFQQLAKTLLTQIKNNPEWTTVQQVPTTEVQALSGKTGEKMELKRFARFQVPGNGLITSYIHMGSKLAVLVQLNTNKPVASDSIKDLAREIALQIAGASPLYINRAEIPADVIQREKDIAKKQLEGQKKPPEILEKIAVGKLQQFYEAQCLLDQPHVRDASGKTRIQDLIDGVARKEGIEINVSKFVRFRVGAD